MSRTLTQTHKRFFPLQPARKSGIVYTPKIQCVREKIGKLPFSFHHLEQLADSNNGNRLYKMNQLKSTSRNTCGFTLNWVVLWRQKSKIQSKCRPLGDLIISSWIFPLKNHRVQDGVINSTLLQGGVNVYKHQPHKKGIHGVQIQLSSHQRVCLFAFVHTLYNIVRDHSFTMQYTRSNKETVVDRNVFIAVLSVYLHVKNVPHRKKSMGRERAKKSQ